MGFKESVLARLLKPSPITIGDGVANERLDCPAASTPRVPEEVLSTLLDRLPDVFFAVDPQGRISWASPSVSKMFGYPPEEIVGMESERIYAHPQDRAKVLEQISAGSGAPVVVEFEARRKDGTTFWVAINACATLDKSGRVTGSHGSLRDVTAHWMIRRTLADSEDRFRRLSDVATEAICIHFLGKIIDFNKAFEALFGYERWEFLQMMAWDVIHPDDVPLAQEKVRQYYEHPYEVRGLRKNGTSFPMEIYSKQSWMGDKQVRVTSIRDLSERRKTENSLFLLSQAVEQSPVPLAIVDSNGLVCYINPSHQSSTGYPADGVIGFPLSNLYPGSAGMVLDALWQTLKSGGKWRGELEVSRRDGTLQWQHIYASPVVLPGGEATLYLVQMEDISIRKQQEQRILHQARFDQLTGLPNRANALDHLSREIEAARTLGANVVLMFIDLDEFKSINDSLGHEYGDALLVQAAERLQTVADSSVTVARFGGDEFLLILGPDRCVQAEGIAATLVKTFSRSFTVAGHELITTVSIGVARHPEDGATPQALLRNADSAMYRAKRAGRNRYCFFTKHMSDENHLRLSMENEMRRAIGTAQFHIHYQPIVALDTGRIVAVEALARWNNPALGAVPPLEFIPLAESTGLIVPLGRTILNAACQAVRQWKTQGFPAVRVAVNVSPRQFQDSDFAEDVERILDNTGLSPHQLELEMTESLLIRERSEIKGRLRHLKALGVRLVLDDFGTGYSSLGHLQQYPFDSLKIDRSFLIGIQNQPHLRLLVDAIITLARGLGLTVTGEGVETPSQLAYLKERGCELVQGYLFSRPLPEEQLLPLLQREEGFTKFLSKGTIAL